MKKYISLINKKECPFVFHFFEEDEKLQTITLPPCSNKGPGILRLEEKIFSLLCRQKIITKYLDEGEFSFECDVEKSEKKKKSLSSKR